jgi:hypothetical protein
MTAHDRRSSTPPPIAKCVELCDSLLVDQHTESGLVRAAVLSGGPMDGQEHSIEGETSELCVVMTDGQQHRYVRTDDFQILSDDRSALVFEWTGRYLGPK